VLATSYHSGRCFTFVQGQPGHPVWVKSRRVVLPVELTVESRLGVGVDPAGVSAGRDPPSRPETSTSATVRFA
jgi:hypothetical protein